MTKIAKAHETLSRMSTAGTPSITARIKYPTARMRQSRFGIVKVNKSMDADSAITMGKKAKARRWRTLKAIFSIELRGSGPRPACGLPLD
ncbi:MAG: hypothetical protein WA397_20810 [Roseiarcus sp.]